MEGEERFPLSVSARGLGTILSQVQRSVLMTGPSRVVLVLRCAVIPAWQQAVVLCKSTLEMREVARARATCGWLSG